MAGWMVWGTARTGDAPVLGGLFIFHIVIRGFMTRNRPHPAAGVWVSSWVLHARSLP